MLHLENTVLVSVRSDENRTVQICLLGLGNHTKSLIARVSNALQFIIVLAGN